MSSSMVDFLNERKKKLSSVDTEVIKETKSVVQNEHPVIPPTQQPLKVELCENDVKVLKYYSTQNDIDIPTLVSLVLKEKTNKTIKESHIFDLKLRKYIDENGDITNDGSAYLAEDSTKNRIKELLKG